jgi:creatinine amidohydrolase
MFVDELEEAFAACPVAYFSYGLCEPHGPQNTLGLDAVKAHGIACRAAHEYGGIVAPPSFWHMHETGLGAQWAAQSIGEVERPWMTAMPAWMYFKNVAYHVRQADVLGFRAAVFLTGHYGGLEVVLRRVLDLLQPHVGTRLCGLADHEANKPGFDHDNESGGDHAGKVETSLLWAVNPECVDMSRMPEKGEPGKHWAMGSDAHDADRRVGERMVADEARWLGAKAEELLADYDAADPEHSLRTFEQVETLWETVIKPELVDTITTRREHPGMPPVPEDSVWYPNSHIPEPG